MPKKITEEEFDQRCVAIKKHFNINILTPFVSVNQTRDVVDYVCDNCKQFGKKPFNQFVKKDLSPMYGCFNCRNINISERKTTTLEAVKNKLIIIRQTKNISVSFNEKEYVSIEDTMCSVICNSCGNEKSTRLKNLFAGDGGCAACLKKKAAIKRRLSRKQFMEGIQKSLNNGYKILLEYEGFTTVNCSVNVLCVSCNSMMVRSLRDAFRLNIMCECKKKNSYSVTGAKKRIPLKDIQERIRKSENDLSIRIEYKEEEYTGVKTIVFCTCVECNHQWNTSLSSVFSGHGCKRCADKKSAIGRSMKEGGFNSLCQTLKKKKISVQTKFFIGLKKTENISFCCDDCGYIWETSLSSIDFRSGGCPKCAWDRRARETSLSEKEFNSRVNSLYKENGIIVLDDFRNYKNGKSVFSCFCISCLQTWESPFSYLSSLKVCAVCQNGGLIAYNEVKYNIIKQQIENENNVTITSSFEEYINFGRSVKYVCNVCGKEQNKKLYYFYCGHGCPRCCLNNTKPEQKLEKFLEVCGIENKKNDRKQLVFIDDNNKTRRREIDFWIESLRVGIEFHGLRWHCSVNQKLVTTYKSYHREKYDLATEAGITLIQIFEDEYTNNPDLVHSIIRYKVGKPLHTYTHNDCAVISMCETTAAAFIAANSFDTFNPDHNMLSLTLKDTNETVAAITWYKVDNTIHFKYYVARDTVVVDGLARLLNTLVSFNPGAIYETASDARYTLHDAEYVKYGMALDHITEPECYLLTNNYKTRLLSSSERLVLAGDNTENLPEIYGVGHNVYRYFI